MVEHRDEAQDSERRAEGAGVTREVDLPVDADEVWEALTDAERVSGWFGARVEWEVAPGGQVHVGAGDRGEPARRGCVDEVEAGRLLRFRWWPSEGDGDGGSAVTYLLEPVPSGTRLVITEVPVPSASLRAQAPSTPSTCAAWDVRVVGLWLGFHAALSCRRA